ncbi:N-acetylmuramoyl-L-alanine amidase [Rhodohalobacter sulfatireducens]|uniref:N-acetylmuramoyl-L-alanine amidase n=1 Tax=Rhodohalobacter sulfatireducens TaxID=2911366 RepID=A0ABS9KEL8_9BACT|nr:N-acetylmuramoyl-L-alanine amidase [Rhodohalobacter sulfatireducens]MCG2589299.1 N-acetylmuramoyl-L-alanine amidase [Rhodohalobacter sulfatireducens]
MLRFLQILLLVYIGFVTTTLDLIAQNSSDWQTDTTKIHTEHIQIDFSTTNILKSTENAKLSDGGIQKIDPDARITFVSKQIEVPINNISPFLALGSRFVFSQVTDQPESLLFEVRYAFQSGDWSEWEFVENDDHLTTSPDTLIGTLQFLPSESQFIQFRITLPKSLNGQTIQLRSLNLSFTSPGSTPSTILEEIRQKSVKVPDSRKRIFQSYPMPEFVTRTDWGSPDGQEPSGPVSLTNVTHQIVHHTAGTNSSSDWPAVVRSTWEYHVNTNGWSDIGYNWLIDPNGVIYQGRGWINGNDEVLGAHFCGTNSNTMGVALMGNFEEVKPTLDSQNSLIELLAWKSDEKNIDPIGKDFHPSSGFNLFTISGHRDGCSTLCPGENLYMNLPQIRDAVHEKIGHVFNPPVAFTVKNNFPNPFFDQTTLTFSIPDPGNVRITVWNAAGKLVEVLTDRFYEAQTHTEMWKAANYASGVYFGRVEYEGLVIVEKMLVIR